MIRLRATGQNEIFECLEKLQEELKNNHIGDHVSLVYLQKSGLQKAVYLSISDDGLIYESYGSKREYDFNKLKQTLEGL